MVAMTIFAMFAGFVTLGRWLNYISLLSWSYIGLLDLTKSGNWPTVRYAITFLLAGILLMTGSAMLWYTNKDLRG